MQGDVRERSVVAAALTGADAVLWCVGVTARSGGDIGQTALPTVVQLMGDLGVRRFVGVSGAGANLPGDVKGRQARLISALTHRLAGDVVGDKEREHAILAASALTWTQVRPPRLSDRPGIGRYRLTTTAPGLLAPAVPRSDVALAMLELAEGSTSVNTADNDADTRQSARRPSPAWPSAAPYVIADPA
jgi:uncharacterized protein YbjT (DUF2867 family)